MSTIILHFAWFFYTLGISLKAVPGVIFLLISHEISHGEPIFRLVMRNLCGFESHRRHDLKDPHKYWISENVQCLCGFQRFIYDLDSLKYEQI